MDTIARQLDAARHQFKTTYSRQGMEANIVHIGFGAFHRGHQAVYNDLTNEITGNRWGIFELNLFGDAELVDALNAQQGLFSVVETSASAINSRLVRTVTGALHTPKSGIQAAIEKLTEPQVKIVSLTITEKVTAPIRGPERSISAIRSSNTILPILNIPGQHSD